MVIAGLDAVGVFCYSQSPYAHLCIDNLSSPDVFHWPLIWECFLQTLPYTLGVTVIWFAIAYFANTAIIRHATGARPLERKENLRVYNIVENLCIAGNIYMPKINIVDDPSLNAFASGIDDKSYTITLTTGIIEKLDDDELSAVVAHELTHIKNRVHIASHRKTPFSSASAITSEACSAFAQKAFSTSTFLPALIQSSADS